MNITENYRWKILGLASFCLLAFAIIFQTIPPILRILVDALEISYAQAGALMGLFSLPSLFLSLPGGLLIDRLGPKRVGATSIIFMAVGTAIVALGGSFGIMCLGRIVAGIGAAFLLVVMPKIVTSWFIDKELGLAMGIFNIAMPLGTILSLNFMGVIAVQFNWRFPIWISFAVSIIALILFLKFYQSRDMGSDSEPGSEGFLSIIKEAGYGIWLVGLSWGLLNAGLLSFFTYAPDFFVSKGVDVAKAGLYASYPMWGSVILAPIIGFLIDRVGKKWLFVSIGCAGIAILLLLIPQFINQAALITIVLGLFLAVLTPAIFSFPAELLPEKIMGFGFGILGLAVGLGMSSGPFLVGILRDATGNYLLSFTAMAALVGAGIIPMIILKVKG